MHVLEHMLYCFRYHVRFKNDYFILYCYITLCIKHYETICFYVLRIKYIISFKLNWQVLKYIVQNEERFIELFLEEYLDGNIFKIIWKITDEDEEK